MSSTDDRRAAFRSSHEPHAAAEGDSDGAGEGHAYDAFAFSFRGEASVEMAGSPDEEAAEAVAGLPEPGGEEADPRDSYGVAMPMPMSPARTRPVRAPSHRESAASVSNVDRPFYWSYRFEEALHANDAGASVAEVAEDFNFAATSYGRVIVLEQALPVRQQTIKAVDLGGVAGGVKFVVAGIVFKFAVNAAGVYDSDAEAAKVAGHELRGCTALFSFLESSGLSEGVQVPLMALVDFRGFRVHAAALLPISSDATLVYGSDSKGDCVVNRDAAFDDVMARVGADLNLARHSAGSSERASIVGPADIEGHSAGGRYYLCDLSRLFPPEGPPASRCAHLTQQLRPEFVRRFHRPLDSDAFSMFLAADPNCLAHNADVVEATTLLRDTIRQCAAMLDTLFIRRGRVLDVVALVRAYGVNMRHLGRVRAACFNAGARRALLQEIVQRCVKNEVREKLRRVAAGAAMKGMPHEVPFLEAVAAHMNLVAGHSELSVAYRRRGLKKTMELLFPGALSSSEMRADVQLFVDAELDVGSVFSSVHERVGAAFSAEAVHLAVTELTCGDSNFRLYSQDVEALEPRTKAIEVVSMSQGETLLREAQALLLHAGYALWGGRASAVTSASFRAHTADHAGDVLGTTLSDLLRPAAIRWHDGAYRGELARAGRRADPGGEFGVLTSAVSPALLPLFRRATASLAAWVRANPARVAGRIELAKSYALCGVVTWDVRALELCSEHLQIVLDLLDPDSLVALEILEQLTVALVHVTHAILRPIFLQTMKFSLRHYYRSHVLVRSPAQVRAAGEHVRLLLHCTAVAEEARTRMLRRRGGGSARRPASERLQRDRRLEGVRRRVGEWERAIRRDTVFLGAAAAGHVYDAFALFGVAAAVVFFASNNTLTYYDGELSHPVERGLGVAKDVGACTAASVAMVFAAFAFRELWRYARLPAQRALAYAVPVVFVPSYIQNMLWYTSSVPAHWKSNSDAHSLVTLWHLCSLVVNFYCVYVPMLVFLVYKVLRNRRMGVGTRFSFVTYDVGLLLSFFNIESDAVRLLAEVELETAALDARATGGGDEGDDASSAIMSLASDPAEPLLNLL